MFVDSEQAEVDSERWIEAVAERLVAGKLVVASPFEGEAVGNLIAAVVELPVGKLAVVDLKVFDKPVAD